MTLEERAQALAKTLEGAIVERWWRIKAPAIILDVLKDVAEEARAHDAELLYRANVHIRQLTEEIERLRPAADLTFIRAGEFTCALCGRPAYEHDRLCTPDQEKT